MPAQERSGALVENEKSQGEKGGAVAGALDAAPPVQAEQPPIQGADTPGRSHGAKNGRQDSQSGARGFLSRLTVNEWLTFLVGVGSLAVSYLTYKNASDTSDLKDAVAGLTKLVAEAQRQAGAMQSQAEAAKEANEINRRTLAASFSSSVHFTQGEFRLHTDANEAPRIHVLIPMGNDGGTTTSGLTYAAVCATFTDRPADPYSPGRVRAARRYSVTLAPKQTVRPIVCSYSLNEWAFIIAFKADLYVYGQATYRDTVNPAETHAVEFCTRLYDIRFSGSPFNPGPFAMAEECESHNCRDAECAAQHTAPPKSERTAF